MSPEGYIIGMLTLLDLRRGAQEPVLTKCRWKGVPAKALAWLHSKTKKKISVRNADGWILADCVAAGTGAVHTAFSLLQLLQLHRPSPALEFQLWQYEEEPWFPRAYFLFCRLRSSDFIQWLVEWVGFCQQHRKPGNEKLLRSNMFFEWGFAETYTPPLGRVSIVTTELSLISRADTKVRNKELLLACGSQAFEHWSAMLRASCSQEQPDVEALQQAALKMENVGEFVGKNTVEFLLTDPKNRFEQMYDAAGVVLMGANTEQILAGTDATIVAVAADVRRAMPKRFEYQQGDGDWTKIELPKHTFSSGRRVQLNLCKLCQVEKTLEDGVLWKPRRLRSGPFRFDFSPLLE